MELSVSQTFGILRAEDEPWLDQCFVLPVDFDRLTSNRSVIVFGGAGSGKTALYEMLKRNNLPPDGAPARLLVDWRIATPAKDLDSPTSTTLVQVQQIFDLCATQLATHVAHFPNSFQAAPLWARDRVSWFVHRCIRGPLRTRLGQLLEGDLPGTETLHQLIETPPQEVLYEDAAPEQILDELCMALKPMGLQGIWVMADNIERLVPIDEDRLVENLRALLATLPLFERSELAFKLFIPKHREAEIIRTSSIERHRIVSFRLHWTPDELRQMINRRLQLVLNQEDFTLHKLCDAPNLCEWLEKTGGESPRHWLDQILPLVQHYVANRLHAPIDNKLWQKLRAQHPPQFYLARDQQSVMVGGRKIELDEIPSKALDMLTYLYEHGNKIVTKEEFYFRAYLGKESIPQSVHDEGFQGRVEFEGVVDTNLWRLRGALEPDPKHPVLLETIRGRGVRLNVRW